jgi:hypothetical protein
MVPPSPFQVLHIHMYIYIYTYTYRVNVRSICFNIVLNRSLHVIFDHCRRSIHLIHAYILAEHIAHATHLYGTSLENSTLGQISATGAGLRWRLLQSCLAKCLYLRSLLNVKLSIHAVENVDELLTAMAIVHLNQAPSSEVLYVYHYHFHDHYHHDHPFFIAGTRMMMMMMMQIYHVYQYYHRVHLYSIQGCCYGCRIYP